MVVGLFEEDRLIYSFLLACSVGSARDKVFRRDVWGALLGSAEGQVPPGELMGPAWLPEKVRSSLAAVSNCPLMADCVRGLCASEGGDGVWREMYEGERPAGQHEYFTDFESLQRLLFNLYFCKDKVVLIP